MSETTWSVVVSSTREATWREAIAAAHGNISGAARAIGISRAHAMRLNKQFDLTEFAAKLRIAAGGSRTRHGERRGIVTGSPKKSKTHGI